MREETPGPACAGEDPELFFPDGVYRRGTRQLAMTEALAKSVCRGCLRKDACLEEGLALHGHGVWGGMTADERADERRRRGTTLPIRKPWENLANGLSTTPAAVQQRAHRKRQEAAA